MTVVLASAPDPATPHLYARADRLLLSIADTAAALSVSRWQIYDLLNRGELQSVQLGRRRLVVAADLARFIRQQSEGASS